MKQVTLTTKKRTERGRSSSARLRKAGRLPAVFYGDSGNTLLSVDTREFWLAYRQIAGRAALLELKLEDHDEPAYAIIQELQTDPVSDEYLHLDLKEIVRGQEMEADIPLHTIGIADGVKNYGGVLEVNASDLRVRCRPRHLPEYITLNVEDLEIGKSIHLSEVDAPEGVTFLGDPDMVVVSCVGASDGSSGAAEEEEGEEEAVVAEAGENSGE